MSMLRIQSKKFRLGPRCHGKVTLASTASPFTRESYQQSRRCKRGLNFEIQNWKAEVRWIKKEEFKWGARLKSVYHPLKYFNLLVHFHGLLVLSNIHIQIVIQRATYTLTKSVCMDVLFQSWVKYYLNTLSSNYFWCTWYLPLSSNYFWCTWYLP